MNAEALAGCRILIAEDEMFIAQDIAMAVEDAGGSVIGPIATVAEGLKVIGDHLPDAAILDVNLLDGEVTPVLQSLLNAGIPVVVNTGTRVPAELKSIGDKIVVFSKPTHSDRLVESIARNFARSA